MSESRQDFETEPEPEAHVAARSESRPCLGFVVLHDSSGPERVGGWLAVPPPEHGKPCILGRGAPQADDEYVRLEIVQQRPGANSPLAPLENRSLSRKQLLVQRTTLDALHVTNVGRCRLLVNGTDTARGLLGPGDVLELGSQLVLLCARRPAKLAGPRPASFAFGAADPHGFVGESPAAWRLRAEVATVAPRAGHVLVLGATGTGKELVAGALHALSSRSGPWVARNAATLPESLVDAELFGNLKDYPNPGMPDRKGLVGSADGGTLFLDELPELPPSAQPHLLRVLDAGEYQRLGEATVRRSRFRLIAATNRPETSLREDVLARFDFRLRIPDLAERADDIPFIVHHLFARIAGDARELCARFSTDEGLPRMSAAFVRQLARHVFRTNLREVRALLWNALHGSHGDCLEWPGEAANHAEAAAATGRAPEADAVRRVLAANAGSIEKSWRELGLPSRHAMTRLLRKHGITVKKQLAPR